MSAIVKDVASQNTSMCRQHAIATAFYTVIHT